MKTFIAYRFTGEDPSVLEPLLRIVRDGLQARGIDSYCTFFDEGEFKSKSFSRRQIMDHAFRIIDEASFLFVILTSASRSEGLLMEVGYCIARNIPVVVAIKEGVGETYVPDMAAHSFYWENEEDLAAKIEAVQLD